MSTYTLTELEEAYAIAPGVVLGKASRGDNLGVLQVSDGRTGTEVVLGSSRNGPFNVMAFLAAGIGAAVIGKLHDTWEVSCYDGQAGRDQGGMVKVEPNGGGVVLTVYDYVANSANTVLLDEGACRDLTVTAAGLLFDM